MRIIFSLLLTFSLSVASANYTLLDHEQYKKTVEFSREKIKTLIPPHTDLNNKITWIAAQLADIPYLKKGAMGEGDWQPTASTYQPGALHIQQDPVYRFDGLDCQTLVQVAMGLFYSKNLAEFENNILKIAYGAAGKRHDVVHYFNRNNFTDADFNPVNQRNGFLQDITTSSPDAKFTSAKITPKEWFLQQQNELTENVRVLSANHASKMIERFTKEYPKLALGTRKVSISYFPKELFALKQADGSYQPNHSWLNKIPVPAVVEIVRNAKTWVSDGKKIKDKTGTELNVSHMGLIYRQNFKKGELIYQKITCNWENWQSDCNVRPIRCEKKHCIELMFVHATEAHPEGYFWYKKSDGQYACTSSKPIGQYTYCNRVERIPLSAYITDFQYGAYRFMDTPSILGLHIEKLLPR